MKVSNILQQDVTRLDGIILDLACSKYESQQALGVYQPEMLAKCFHCPPASRHLQGAFLWSQTNNYQH